MGKDLVTIATFSFPAEAEAFRLLLEEEGIRTYIADDNVAGTNWLYSNAVGGTKIQVATSDADRANEIIRQHEKSQKKRLEKRPGGDITFACEDCGKKITFPAERRGGVEICPHCDNYVDVPDDNDEDIVAEAAPPILECGTLPPTETKNAEQPGAAYRDNRQLWWELFAVLCLVYFPSLFTNIADITGYYSHSPYFFYGRLYHIVVSMQVIFPLIMILWLSKEPWRKFGLVRPSWVLDAVCGVAIWFCHIVSYQIVRFFLPAWMFDKSPPYHIRPDNVFAFLLVFVSCISGVFLEELVFRGYLVTRLERLLRSSWLAVLISASLFGSLHLYQGIGHAITTAVMGLIYASAFCWRRSLWPLCVAHAVTNLLYFM